MPEGPQFEFIKPQFTADSIAGVLQGSQSRVQGAAIEARGVAAGAAAISQGVAAMGKALGEKFEAKREEEKAKLLSEDFAKLIKEMEAPDNWEDRRYRKFEYAEKEFQTEVNAMLPPGPHNHDVLDAMQLDSAGKVLEKRGYSGADAATKAASLFHWHDEVVLTQAAATKQLQIVAALTDTHDIDATHIRLLLETRSRGRLSHKDFEEGLREEVAESLGFNTLQKEQRAVQMKIAMEQRKEQQDTETRARVSGAVDKHLMESVETAAGKFIRRPVGGMEISPTELGGLAHLYAEAYRMGIDSDIIANLEAAAGRQMLINIVSPEAKNKFAKEIGQDGDKLMETLHGLGYYDGLYDTELLRRVDIHKARIQGVLARGAGEHAADQQAIRSETAANQKVVRDRVVAAAELERLKGLGFASADMNVSLYSQRKEIVDTILQQAVDYNVPPEVVQGLLESAMKPLGVTLVSGKELDDFSIDRKFKPTDTRQYKESNNLVTGKDDPVLRGLLNERLKELESALKMASRESPVTQEQNLTVRQRATRDFGVKLQTATDKGIADNFKTVFVKDFFGPHFYASADLQSQAIQGDFDKMRMQFRRDGTIKVIDKAGGYSLKAELLEERLNADDNDLPRKMIAAQIVEGVSTSMSNDKLKSLVADMDAEDSEWYEKAVMAITKVRTKSNTPDPPAVLINRPGPTSVWGNH